MIFIVVELPNCLYFITGLCNLPAATIVCVGILEAAIFLFKYRLNFNVEVFIQNTNNEAIHKYISSRIARLDGIFRAC
ncbi:hypothetical protein WS95_22575 [Burkholderia sp. MSMB1826]|nr:hypothetical protein WS95_22575 [Burkholderia sp. MSMB1826]